MSAGSAPITTRRAIGIVAGGGAIVGELIAALSAAGQPHAVAAIKGEADAILPPFEGDHIQSFDWGEIGRILSFFKKHQCEDLVLLGRVSKRPDFRSILGDPGTLVRIPKIVAAMRGGDDSLLKRVIDLLEAEGFRVVGIQDVAPDFLLNECHHGNMKITPSIRADIAKGKAVLADLGRHDIGQALVIHDGRIWAVEGAEGTDAMIARIRALRAEQRITKRPVTGILIKAAKIGQDRRVDLPAIGPETIRMMAEAGLAGLVVQSGAVLVAERAETLRRVSQCGLFLLSEGDFHHD